MSEAVSTVKEWKGKVFKDRKREVLKGEFWNSRVKFRILRRSEAARVSLVEEVTSGMIILMISSDIGLVASS